MLSPSEVQLQLHTSKYGGAKVFSQASLYAVLKEEKRGGFRLSILRRHLVILAQS